MEPAGTDLASAIIAVGNVKLVTVSCLELHREGDRIRVMFLDAAMAPGCRNWRERNASRRALERRPRSAARGAALATQTELRSKFFSSPGLHADHVSLRIPSASPAEACPKRHATSPPSAC